MLTNNDILKKIKIALSLKTEDIREILELSDMKLNESEITAFFRKEDDRNYREAGDQVLRRFLDGLILKNRGPWPEESRRAPAPRPTLEEPKAHPGPRQPVVRKPAGAKPASRPPSKGRNSGE